MEGMKRLHKRAGVVGMAVGIWLVCGAVAGWALPPTLGGGAPARPGSAASVAAGAASANDAATAVGATLAGGHTVFRIWAPEAKSVKIWSEATGARPQDMKPDAGRPGYWSFSTKAHAGTPYNFHVDGHIHRDPRGRVVDAERQLSFVADPAAYKWGATEATWKMQIGRAHV